MFTVIAIQMLQNAGHEVTPAEGVPGLWNVAGIANDVTTNQLVDLAEKYGAPAFPVCAGPVIDWRAGS